MSHKRTAFSGPEDAIRRPHGDTARMQTESAWPVKRWTSVVLSTSHSRTKWSALPVTKCRPSGRKATVALLTPTLYLLTSAPVEVFHRRTVVSQLAVAASDPSGE